MASRLIFIDERAPVAAKEYLTRFGEVVDFMGPDGAVYEALRGHPDIFMFQHNQGIITAPQMPAQYAHILDKNNISRTEGHTDLGPAYPATAAYNASYTRYGILHNKDVAAQEIKNINVPFIHCKQAYARCSAFEAGGVIITSDLGIEKVLNTLNVPVFYINPSEIVLPGFNNGFFGGCCGFSGNQLFICGNLRHIENGYAFTNLMKSKGVEVIELYDGPLWDVGGIFVFELI